jgi:hypothetical protein
MAAPELRVLQGGSSNSRPIPESRNRRGIDTVRYRFRSDPCGKLRFCNSGDYQEGPPGEVYRQADGIRIGAHHDGTLYAEGRLANILYGPNDHSLPPAIALRAGALLASEKFGFPVDHRRHAAIGRVDVATELRFDDGNDGLAFLHALSLADVPWAKVGTEGKKRDRIETVVFRSARGRTVLMRAYDKGVESQTAAPGEIIRFERQRRYRKSVELSLVRAVDLDLRSVFVGRELRSLAEVSAEVVCDLWGAIDRLNELVLEGTIAAPKGDALAGLLARGGSGHRLSTWYRFSSSLRAVDAALACDLASCGAPQEGSQRRHSQRRRGSADFTRTENRHPRSCQLFQTKTDRVSPNQQGWPRYSKKSVTAQRDQPRVKASRESVTRFSSPL